MSFSNNKDPYSKKVGENVKYCLLFAGIIIIIALIYEGIKWLVNQ